MWYMRKLEKAGKHSSRRCKSGWAAALCLLIAAGCSTSSGSHPDVLLGEIHPQGPTQQYGSAPPNNANQPGNTKTTGGGGVPGIPSTQGPYSNVALASMQDGRPPLAIDENNGARTSAFTPSSSNGPTVIPVPRDPGSAAVPNNNSLSSAMPSGDILQAQLRARGVNWQKQETVPDGIRFTCIVPNRVNPESSKIYEATARDLVTAIQAILVQIDQK